MDWIEKYDGGTVKTEFFVDHSDIEKKIQQYYKNFKFPFGQELTEGEEWLSFIFNSQKIDTTEKS